MLVDELLEGSLDGVVEGAPSPPVLLLVCANVLQEATVSDKSVVIMFGMYHGTFLLKLLN